MATGVEIAGLVLSALPLILYGLEHFNDVKRPMAEFFGWQRYVRKLIRQLLNVQAHYQQIFQDLLGTELSPADLQKLLREPEHPLWKAGPVVDYLQEKLGFVHGPFMLIMSNMAGRTVEIAAALGIPGSGTGSKAATMDELFDIIRANPGAAGRTFDIRKRLKFTMEKRRIKEILEELDTDIREMDRFIGRARNIQRHSLRPTVVNTRKPVSDQVRSNATVLYDILAQKLCPGPAQHSVCLSLEQALPPRSDIESSFICGGRQDVILVLLFFGVCIGISGCLQTEVIFTTNTSTSSLQPSQLQSLDPNVNNICSYLNQFHSGVSTQEGLQVDSAGELRTCGTAAVSKLEQDQLITLDGLLPSLISTTLPNARYCLVVRLVTAYLYFGSTAWLASGYNSRCIHFLRSRPGQGPNYNITKPLLERVIAGTSQHSRSGPPVTMPHNDKLVSLALLLLEICTGQPDSRSISQNNVIVDYNAIEAKDLERAKRRYNEELRNGGLSDGYGSAILFCLQGWIDESIDPSSPQFQSDFMDKVINPLRLELEFTAFT